MRFLQRWCVPATEMVAVVHGEPAGSLRACWHVPARRAGVTIRSKGLPSESWDTAFPSGGTVQNLHEAAVRRT